MSSDIAIKVENLSKCYQIYDTPRDRLKQFILPPLQRMLGCGVRQYYREFWALKNVSFEVRKGETVGVIGRNGSGKSTLLQMICGTLTPSSGNINACGRIAALLELGSGFNPDFTGVENIYLNASVLGLTSQEIDACYKLIVEFADIGDFVEQPVRTYSSGMVMRLAFSVAIHAQPSILVVDEALAVGDFSFQEKCYSKLREMRSGGVTILFVTHDTNLISSLCDEAILLHQGEGVIGGEVNKVINEYKKIMTDVDESRRIDKHSGDHSSVAMGTNKNAYLISKSLHKSGSGEAEILDWFICVNDIPRPVSVVEFGDLCSVVIDFVARKSLINPNVGFFFSDQKGLEIAGSAINHEDFFIRNLIAGDCFRVEFKFRMALRPGKYFFNIGLSESGPEGIVSYDRQYSIAEIDVIGNKVVVGACNLLPEIKIEKL